MTGLLHRLAQRAAGTAVTVRSDAVLPFGADGQGWQAAAAPVRPAPGQTFPAAPLSSAALPMAAQVAPGGAAAAAPVMPPADLAGLRPEFGGPEPARPRRADLGARPPLIAEPAASPLLPPARAALLVEEPAAAASVDPVPPREPTAGRAEPLPQAAAAAFEPASPMRAADRWPAPLRPAAAPLAARPTAPATAGRGPRSAVPATASPGNDPAEVHIHIGRIEVTALPQAAAPRTRPPARAPAQPLDAYLAARSRK